MHGWTCLSTGFWQLAPILDKRHFFREGFPNHAWRGSGRIRQELAKEPLPRHRLSPRSSVVPTVRPASARTGSAKGRSRPAEDGDGRPGRPCPGRSSSWRSSISRRSGTSGVSGSTAWSGNAGAASAICPRTATSSPRRRGLKLTAGIRRNMRNRPTPLPGRLPPRARFIVETLFDRLKTGTGLEHARRRSPVNAFVHNLSRLVACTLGKAKIKMTDVAYPITGVNLKAIPIWVNCPVSSGIPFFRAVLRGVASRKKQPFRSRRMTMTIVSGDDDAKVSAGGRSQMLDDAGFTPTFSRTPAAGFRTGQGTARVKFRRFTQAMPAPLHSSESSIAC